MKKLEIYDIYDQMQHVPFWRTLPFRAVVLILVVALCAVIVWWVVKKIRGRAVHQTIFERSLAYLAMMKNQDFATEEDRKKGYFDLTRIIKELLTECDARDITPLTDHELVEYVQRVHVRSLCEQIEVVVMGAQEIKYAQAQAAKEQLVHDIDRVIVIVQQEEKYKNHDERSSH